MRVDELSLPEDYKQLLRHETLNEPQERAVRAGLLEGANLVVASPTASGKTLIAELAMLQHVAKGGKVLYLVPLRALGSEKYAEFVERYGSRFKIALSLGDYDADSHWLGNCDVIIASNEKVDSLLRHSVPWLNQITLVIADEVHLLDDVGRGPTLEIVLTSLRSTKPQFLALSATISNAREIATWLGARLVESAYRPIPLSVGTYYPHTLQMEKQEARALAGAGDSTQRLVADTANRGKQSLVFVSTRRSAEACAENVGEVLGKQLSMQEREDLAGLSKKILGALSPPTQQCRRLAAVVARGAAFHHAGLVGKQRSLIEDAFRQGTLKALTATPTLAFGMNLPAYRVIVRDTTRYTGHGSEPLTIMEVQQMLGRAGRPTYDTEGEAVLVAATQGTAERLAGHYLYSDPEPIYSKLSAEPVLRSQVLALIASDRTRSNQDLERFFSQTFFSHQYGNAKEVMARVAKALQLLENLAFIRAGRSFISQEFVPAFELGDTTIEATPLGKRVAELYIDPLSAAALLQAIQGETTDTTDIFLTLTSCIEMRPLLTVKRNDEFVEEAALTRTDTPDVADYEYDEHLAQLKTALLLEDWCSERTEKYLNEKYGVAPGELYVKMQSAEWLLFAAAELARLLGNKEKANLFRQLQLRVSHGIKAELLVLIQLKGIGRVRARLLYKNGVKSLVDVRKASPERLHTILGSRKLADDLKRQTEETFTRKMSRIKRRGKYQE